MEQPFEFDVWCKVKESETKVAVEWTSKLHDITLSNALKTVRHAMSNGEYVQIFVNCGWDDIPGLRNHHLPAFAKNDECVVTQSTYSPSVCTGYCDKHELAYVEKACPVCEGFYISRVVDGMPIVARNDQ